MTPSTVPFKNGDGPAMPRGSAGKLLLIAHQGSRSGAPILLLTFARWLKANTDLRFEVLLLSDGPLRAEFAGLAPTWVLSELNGRATRFGRVLNRFAKQTQAEWDDRAFRRLAARGYSVVFGGSVVCLPWMARFKASTQAQCVCAVHELTWAIGRFFDKSYVEATLPGMDKVVAGSNAVRDNLIANYGIPADRIDVVHAFVDEQPVIRKTQAELQKKMGIDPSAVVIGAVGTSELRKGTDLVVAIAVAFKALRPDRKFKFVWVGAEPGGELVSICQRDATMMGVGDEVVFVAATPEANDYIGLYDVFMLPSREDPFPLVVLTAIRSGKPVIAFERSGGMDELLVDGAGRLVPYLDVRRFAEAIDAVLSDADATLRMTETARARVASRYGADRLARRLYEVLAAVEPAGAATVSREPAP